MTKKYLITTSIFALISVSAVRAADIIIPATPAPVVVVSPFSWSGFYLGGQIGGFLSEVALSYSEDKNGGTWEPVDKEHLPKLSGFVGGIYAGFNFDIDSGFVIGADTDVVLSNKKDTKDIDWLKQNVSRSLEDEEDIPILRNMKNNRALYSSVKAMQHTLEQKWAGATRVRVGFSIERLLPYIAGGVAYTQVKNAFVDAEGATRREMNISDLLHDEEKMMIGFTLGGGIDFSMTDNVILRAEYRYSDFGKKKFANERIEIGYKTNDFRVGVAYKF
ncbi:outer membrane protein [Bartonella doshiae]|uniref:outer membrane protein n=1 Tax=Bartonella doshiae TaxID=33044 RepID=UPI001ABA09F4|nr:outer membrane protein [Bartonella doshiae]